MRWSPGRRRSRTTSPRTWHPVGVSTSTTRRVTPSGPSEAPAGLPDDNVLAQLPSVGGYASIVNGTYNARTLTHAPGQLNVARLGSGDLDGLDLQEIVTAPEYFLLPLRGHADHAARCPAGVRGARDGSRFSPWASRPMSPTAATRPIRRPAGSWRPDSRARGSSANRSDPAGERAADRSRAPLRACGSDSARCTPTGRRPGVRPSRSPRVPAAPPGPLAAGGRQSVWPSRSSPDVCRRIRRRSRWGSGPTSSTAPSPTWSDPAHGGPQGSVDGYSLFVRTAAPHPVYAVAPRRRSVPAYLRGVRRAPMPRPSASVPRPPPSSCATWPGTPDGMPRSPSTADRPSRCASPPRPGASRCGFRPAPISSRSPTALPTGWWPAS